MTGRGREDLTRPPFAVVESLDPAEVGAEMVACFDRIAAGPDVLRHGHALAMRSLALGADEPMYRAGAAIARDVDNGIGAGVPGGYHNPRHYLEVMLCALYLSRTQRLSTQRAGRVVTAALVHDFHHDGSRSSDAPFRLEALAAAKAEPYLRDAGVSRELREQLCALVLATQPGAGVPFARACMEHHAGEPAPSAAGLPAPLERLLEDRDLALEAVLLAEADVLPSIGLTVAHGRYEQDRLAAEWNQSLGAEDKVGFIDRVCPDITIACFFRPNIEALRQAYLAQPKAPTGAGDTPRS